MQRWFAAFAVSFPLFAAECVAQEDAVIVTATRFVERALSAPIGMTIIGADKIRSSTARSLPELLAQEAGIVVRDLSGSPDAQVDLRGFGAGADQNTLVLVDGQRLNEIELTTVRWSSLSLESVERIEVLRGSGAVIYGGGATGGTINIITRSARPSTSSAAVRLARGSLGRIERSAEVSAASERIGVSVRFQDVDSDNYRENNRLEQQNLDGELRLNGTESYLALKFGTENQSLRLPGARTRDQLVTAPRGASTPRDFSARDGSRVGVVSSIHFGDVELSIDAFVRESTRTSSQKDYSSGGLFDVYLDTRSKAQTLSPRIKMPYEFMGHRSSLTIGADAEDWDYTSLRAGSLERLGAPTAKILADQKNRAFYLQNHTELGEQTRLTLGARQQRVQMGAVDRVNAAAYASGKKISSPRAWEIALRHQPYQSSSVYARFGQSFRISTVDESYSQFGGPAGDAIVTLLEPQTSRDHELGFEVRETGRRLRISAFQNDLHNEIHYFAPTFSNINLPPTRRKGLEVDGALTISASLQVFANVSAVDARFRDGQFAGADVRGKSIPLVPRETANVGGTWSVSDNSQIGLSIAHVGKQRYDNDQANTFPGQMPSYQTVAVQFSHRLEGMTLRASIGNLLNEKYYTYAIRNGAGTSFNAYPQPGRAIVFAAEYRI